MDGVSFLPLLRGEAMERGPIFWHYPHYGNQGGAPGCSVRHGDWKLIEFFADGRLELYHLRDDAGETHNRAAEEPEITRHLHAELVAWRESIDAKIPARNAAWADAPAGGALRARGPGGPAR